MNKTFPSLLFAFQLFNSALATADIGLFTKDICSQWNLNSISIMGANDHDQTDIIHTLLRLNPPVAAAFDITEGMNSGGIVCLQSDCGGKFKSCVVASRNIPVFIKSPLLMDGAITHLRFDSQLYSYVDDGLNMTISEHYSFRGLQPVTTTPIGEWSPSEGFRIPVSDMWDRRNDLLGMELKDVMVYTEPLLIPPGKGSDKATGLCVDIVSVLQTRLNFTTVQFEAPDGTFGQRQENGSFSGIMGVLQREEADFTSQLLINNKQRGEIVSFSVTILPYETNVIGRKLTASGVNYTAYALVFSWNAWAVIAAGWVLFGALYWLVYKFLWQSYSSSLLSDVGVKVLELVIQRGAEETTPVMSAKVLSLVAGMSTYFVFQYYSAVLTSEMTVADPPKPIRQLQDVLELDYQMVTWRGSAVGELLTKARPGTAAHRIYTQKMESRPAETLLTLGDIFSAVRDGDRVVSYISWMELAHMDKEKELQEFKVREEVINNLGFAFPKESELAKLFSHYLLKLHEAGIIELHQAKWIPQSDSSSTSGGGGMADSARTLEFESVVFPFFILLSAAVLALATAAVEIGFGRKGNKKRRLTRM